MQQQSQQKLVEEKSVPATLVDSQGNHVAVNEKIVELYGYSEEKLLTMNVDEVVVMESLNHGRKLQKALDGVQDENICFVEDSSGAKHKLLCNPESVEILGETYVLSELEVVEKNIESSEKSESESACDCSASEKEKIARNTRIDAPGGPMSLSEVQHDLGKQQLNVEQTKDASVLLIRAIQDRLEEEEKYNPDGNTCCVLKSVLNQAQKLHERVDD